jgi:hypothetical protein
MANNQIQSKISNSPFNVAWLSGDNKASWIAYKERAEIAKKQNVNLIKILNNDDVASKIIEGDKLSGRYWDGKSMHEVVIDVPEVFYDRTAIKNRSNFFNEVVNSVQISGKNFINPPQFRDICKDKWLTYKLLYQNGIKTPETYIYSEDSLEHLLHKTGFVFVKERVSSQGKNQVVIRELDKNRYSMILSKDSLPLEVKGFHDVIDNLSILGIEDNYIVQEGINVDRLETRVYDFRSLFQRGSQGRIGMTCFYLRVGALASEQANIGKKGHPHEPYVVFDDYDALQKQIRNVGQRVVKAFSKSYIFGEVGIDFVINEDSELIVIEANSKPGSKGLRILREWNPNDSKYYNSGVIPFEYNNDIRQNLGNKLNKFLSNPISYSKYMINTKLNIIPED